MRANPHTHTHTPYPHNSFIYMLLSLIRWSSFPAQNKFWGLSTVSPTHAENKCLIERPKWDNSFTQSSCAVLALALNSNQSVSLSWNVYPYVRGRMLMIFFLACTVWLNEYLGRRTALKLCQHRYLLFFFFFFFFTWIRHIYIRNFFFSISMINIW